MKTHCHGRSTKLLGFLQSTFLFKGVVCFFCVSTCGLNAGAEGAATLPAKSADLFQVTNVWTLRLQFTPEQWQAMEPAETGRGLGGPGGMRFGGPGGPGGFGPAMFLAPSFLKADQNKDEKLSKDEFRDLGEQWFSAWDKEKRGELNLDQLRAGMNSTFMPQPGDNGPNAGPQGPPLQGNDGHRNGLASAAGLDFKYVHADLEFEGHAFRDIGVRYKGNGTYMESRNSLKRSLKLELNRFVKGQKIAGETKLNLHNNVTDASWMNEVLSYGRGAGLIGSSSECSATKFLKSSTSVR